LKLHEHPDFRNFTIRSSSFVLLIKYSGDQIKKDAMGGSCGKYGGWRGAYRVLVGKSDWKEPTCKTYVLTDIKMVLQETG
jgi:hypothetical protein